MPEAESGWRAAISDRLGPCFELESADLSVRLYMDGPEWACWIATPESAPLGARKVTLRQVIAWAPEFRDEAIGLTRARMVEERAKLAAMLAEGLAALAAEDDERAADVLDDLRTWGTRDLRAELAEVGA